MTDARSTNELDKVNEILTRQGVNLLRPTSSDGKKGFMDIAGRWVIEPVYDDVDVFREGVAWVKTGDLWGLIDRDGTTLIEPKYEAAREFNDGLACVRVNGLWGVVDKSGNIVVRPEFDAIYTFDHGVAMMRLNGKYGFVYSADNRVISPVYTKAHNFREGLAAVMSGDKWGFIDMDGAMVIAPEYDGVDDFINGTATVRKGSSTERQIDRHGNIIEEYEGEPDYEFYYDVNPAVYDCSAHAIHGYMDRKGNFAIKPKFQEAYRFCNGLAKVEIDNKCAIIDSSGAYVVEPGDKDIADYENSFFKPLKHDSATRRAIGPEYVRVKRDDRFGVENCDGATIVEPNYDDVQFSDEGVFVVGVKEETENETSKFLPAHTVWRYGLIGLDGKVIVPPVYAYDYSSRGVDRIEFHEQLAAVCVNGKWGYINARGEMVIEPHFENAYNFSQGVAYIQEGRLYGLIDKSGNVLVTPQYTNISSEIKNGYIRVEDKNHRWSVIDTSGRTVVSLETPHDYLLGNCSEGMVMIQHGDSFGYADCRTGGIIQPVYDYVWEFSEGLGIVRLLESQIEANPALARASYLGKLTRAESDGKYGFVNLKGQWIIEPRFDDAKPEFTQGVVFVKEGDKWGLIDMLGQYVVPPTYDDKGSDDYGFVDDRSTVYINGEKKRIDSKGCFYYTAQPSVTAQPPSSEAASSAYDDFPF